MGKYHTKNGKQIYLTNRGHSYPMQWTVQGEEMNNHCARRGTVRSKRGFKCHCEYCTRNTKEIKEKIADKEFEQAKKGVDF